MLQRYKIIHNSLFIINNFFVLLRLKLKITDILWIKSYGLVPYVCMPDTRRRMVNR